MKSLPEFEQRVENLLPRLQQFIDLRLDSQARGRLQASTIVQEACLDALRRQTDYERLDGVPLYVWLRGLARDRLVDSYRRSFGVANRDRQPGEGVAPPVSSAAIVETLVAKKRALPEFGSGRDEIGRLVETLEVLSPEDREIITMRHFEQLSNGEVAEVLGLSESTSSARYVRALERLGASLKESRG